MLTYIRMITMCFMQVFNDHSKNLIMHICKNGGHRLKAVRPVELNAAEADIT